MDIEYVSPQIILQMTLQDYFDTYGDSEATVRQKSMVMNRFNRLADDIRNVFLEHKAQSMPGAPLTVHDLVQISSENYKHIGLRYGSSQYIKDALHRNNLRTGMSTRDIQKWIGSFDVNNAKLKAVLGCLCNQCENERKKDIMRVFEGRDAIVPGYVCCVMVSRNI